jgi:hypothetical protein
MSYNVTTAAAFIVSLSLNMLKISKILFSLQIISLAGLPAGFGYSPHDYGYGTKGNTLSTNIRFTDLRECFLYHSFSKRFILSNSVSFLYGSESSLDESRNKFLYDNKYLTPIQRVCDRFETFNVKCLNLFNICVLGRPTQVIYQDVQ